MGWFLLDCGLSCYLFSCQQIIMNEKSLKIIIRNPHWNYEYVDVNDHQVLINNTSSSRNIFKKRQREK